MQHRFLATVEHPNAENQLNKQLLCNSEADNSCNRKQLGAEWRNGVVYCIKKMYMSYSDFALII